MTPSVPYNDLNRALRRRFGCRVQKITIDAGLDCPNRDGVLSTRGCTYCNARGSGTGAYARGQSISDQIHAGIEAVRRRYRANKFLAYFQSFTNTYGPLETLRSNWETALSIPGVVGLAIGTRPDCVDADVIAVLQRYTRSHLIWIEYGLQSVHDRTLAAINRGHGRQAFMDAISLTRRQGPDVHICAHVILGLPGETRADMLDTAKQVADTGIDGIKLHLLYVVRGTDLEKDYRSGAFRCLSQSAYVETVAEFLALLPPRVIIHRLTGDPHRDELVAPRWALRKTETLDKIRSEMVRRGLCQGCRGLSGGA
jgi:radical SAM protein (TIGR01212 family)